MLMLARWVMGGPLQALTVAAVLAAIPGLAWASAAVVALVVLRKTVGDAILPLLGALVVAVLLHWNAGDISQVVLVLAAWVGAVVLANVRSLAWSLVATGVGAVLILMVAIGIAPDKLAQLMELYQSFYDLWLTQMTSEEADQIRRYFSVHDLVIQAMAMLSVSGAVAALLLARWLQARLYNPGGFRLEFHQLRLTPYMATGLVLVLVISQSYPEARVVLSGVLIPLILAGLALVHGLLGKKPNSTPLLVFFYIGLLLSAGFGVMLLVAVAVIDSLVNFRNRIRKEV